MSTLVWSSAGLCCGGSLLFSILTVVPLVTVSLALLPTAWAPLAAVYLCASGVLRSSSKPSPTANEIDK